MDVDKNEIIERINDDEFIDKLTRKIFIYYDLNKNNYIEKNELMNAMRDVSRKIFNTEPEQSAVETEFKKLDKDNNNLIDILEFRTFVKQYLNIVINCSFDIAL